MKPGILFRSTRGSAISEFLVFTLPFFTALLFMVVLVNDKTMAISEAKNLARQSVRAFVTSPSNELAQARAYQVIDVYQSRLRDGEKFKRKIAMTINCSESPCLVKGGKVTVQIKVSTNGLSGLTSDVVAEASEFVDLWR
jgi:hypothetical protein